MRISPGIRMIMMDLIPSGYLVVIPVELTFKMHLISSCTIFFMLILDILCNGQEKKDWTISFTPAEVTAVSGLCALISCAFTYPEEAKPIKNLLWFQCNKTDQCKNIIFNYTDLKKRNKSMRKIFETKQIKLLEPDLDKNNCSIIMKNLTAEDEGKYAFKVKGSQQNTCTHKVKITIQDKPVIKIPLLKEHKQANLSCSAPFPCPETPPDITWWIKNRGGQVIEVKENITLTTSKSFYLSTLTLIPTSELHNAAVGCEVSYGGINISDRTTIEVMCPKGSDSAEVGNMTEKDTESLNSTAVEAFLKKLELSTILSFLSGMAASALIFSVVLCCWVSCNRDKKHKVLAGPPDTAFNLETVQTNIDPTVTNEQTPLHGQIDAGMSNTQVESTGGAEKSNAGGAESGEVNYAAIDYSLLKKKPPEEVERESVDTEYAEIRRDGRRREAPQNEDDQVQMSNGGSEDQKQKEGEEELYSNSQALKS